PPARRPPSRIMAHSVRVGTAAGETTGTMVLISVAELLPILESGVSEVTVAVLDRVPAADAARSAVMAKLYVLPAGRALRLQLMRHPGLAGAGNPQRHSAGSVSV